MADREVMRLSLERQTVDIVLSTADGEEKTWTLRELDGTQRNKYLNKMTNRVKIGPNGRAVGIKTFDGFQSDLLRACLFDESGEPVSVEDIEQLPSSTQMALFERAQQLSGLNTSEEEAKND